MRAVGAHGKTITFFFPLSAMEKLVQLPARVNGTFFGRAAQGVSAKGICHAISFFFFLHSDCKNPERCRKGATPIPVEKSGGDAR